MTESKPLVLVVMGSDSDWPAMKETVAILRKLRIPCEARVVSAHRTPRAAHELAAGARDAGVRCIIAAAGGAAHLAGVVASYTTLPVIGVPMVGWALDGLDALLSTVQMPAGIPVATVAIGKAGARNAAILAAQMLALNDSELAKRIEGMRDSACKAVEEKDTTVLDESRRIPE